MLPLFDMDFMHSYDRSKFLCDATKVMQGFKGMHSPWLPASYYVKHCL